MLGKLVFRYKMEQVVHYFIRLHLENALPTFLWRTHLFHTEVWDGVLPESLNRTSGSDLG